MTRALISGTLILMAANCVCAETGYDAWLRYTRIDEPAVRQMYDQLPGTVVSLNSEPTTKSAAEELRRGMYHMLGRTLRTETHLPDGSAFVLGTLDQARRIV